MSGKSKGAAAITPLRFLNPPAKVGGAAPPVADEQNRYTKT